MQLLNSFPVLVVDDELHDDTLAGRFTRRLVDDLRAKCDVITSVSIDDAEQIAGSVPQLSAVVIDYDAHPQVVPGDLPSRVGVLTTARIEVLVKKLRARNPKLPILLLADRSTFEVISSGLLSVVDGYIWKFDDTPAFVAGRVEEARREYLHTILPPFFSELVTFTEEARYSWHTPGHGGGAAFLKTPVGAAFHRFFGDNALRSDLSASVEELGSALEHSGPVGAAERAAATVFGADRTMFVTNGRSAANKIVFHACVRRGDVVLVDRHCHRSVMHAIVMTGAIPVYLHPIRNDLGVPGPVPRSTLEPEAIRESLRRHPLVPAGTEHARLAVITNSTYDGLCYDPGQILTDLAGVVDVVLFDEAWFGYGHFHDIYARRHAMGAEPEGPSPAVFATQSTHKLLTALSQASMIHARNLRGVVSPVALNEAFMMHASTSPQYGIIASLDVAAKTMEAPQGTALIEAAIDEATRFRCQLHELAERQPLDGWFFGTWQPPGVVDDELASRTNPEAWLVRDSDTWHGYQAPGDHVMLDPIKVTITTPGLAPHGLAERGIPAAIVSRFLDERGIAVETTGAYSFLVLFSLGITEGKAGTLLAELLEFKRLHDHGALVRDALPKLAQDQEQYADLTLAALCQLLHNAMHTASLPHLIDALYAERSEPVLTPSAAYERLVAGDVLMLSPDDAVGKVSAAMIVPYPPGVPVIMPGERVGDADSALITFLRASEHLSWSLPGFAISIQGIEIDGAGYYKIPVLRDTPA